MDIFTRTDLSLMGQVSIGNVKIAKSGFLEKFLNHISARRKRILGLTTKSTARHMYCTENMN